METSRQQQEEELQQLIAVLPPEEEQVVRSFIKYPSGSGGQSHYERIQVLLVASPYPTLQILQILHAQSKFHIGRIISAALKQMLDDDTSASAAASTRLLSVLANFPEQILEAASMQHRLTEYILSVPWGQNDQLLLSLLARRDAQLLNTILQSQRHDTRWSTPAESRQFVLHLALQEREHFVPRLCQQLKSFNCISDPTLRNNLLILRLANEFALSSQSLDELAKLDNTLAAFDIAAVPVDLQPVHHFFYADFQRLCVLLKFLEKQHEGNAFKFIKVDALLRAPGVLSLIYEYGIQCDSEDVVKIIEDTHKWQLQTPALRCVRAEEMETLTYYLALCHVHNVILEQHDTTIRDQLTLLSAQLRQLRGLSTLCSLLTDVFQLVFLRWEQLQKTNPREGDGDDDEEDDDDDEQYVDDDTTLPRSKNATNTKQRRYGFICRAPVLNALFSYLKSFVTKKLHSQDFKGATEEQQRCFQRLVDAISEALWKFSVLQKIEQSLSKSKPQRGCHLEPEQLLQMIQLHNHTKEKASSDDESRERSYHASSLTRRRSRKQRRAVSFSGPTGSRSAEGPTLEQCRARAHQLRQSGERNVEPQIATATTIALPTDRSIIPKMLSTPEQLAIMALALKNFNDVKYITETFHLEDSQLNRELQFMEHQQLIKQKLASIYANYEALDKAGGVSSGSTVEQIKSVAAKGFELSKIISVVDNFAQAQKLQHSAEWRSLLQRHSSNSQYGFLQQFQEHNLNVLIICDLIINLRFNREITCNLLLVIRRQQQQEQPHHQQTTELSIEPGSREIGAMHLIQNLCECMRLLEDAGRRPALNELLFRHSYALKPAPLALQLQREGAFTALYTKSTSDYAHSRELRTHGPLFQQLKSRHNYYARFCGYMQQLARLLQLRDPNLEYHNTQLLRLDPYQVIGELIYECDITPLEIESNVLALHLNLVHVIALNICPELGGGRKTTIRCVPPKKQESIHNYIYQHNPLLAHLLQAVQSGDLTPINTSETTLNYDCLQQLLDLPEMQILSLMYDGNAVMSALHSYKLDSGTLERLELSHELQLSILLLGIGGQCESSRKLKNRIDQLITMLIEQDPRQIQQANHMYDLGTRAKLLHQHFTKISSSQLAKELIERTLHHRSAALSIPAKLRSQLEHTLSDITIYAKVSSLLHFESWPQAYDFGRQTPNLIFEQLLQGRHYELCYEWCRMVQLTDAAGQQRVCLLTLLDTLLELNDEDQLDGNLLLIAELFPAEVLVNFLDTHKDKMRSLALLQWLIDYLESHARDPSVYRNYQVSLELMRQLPLAERLHFWPLLRYPLLIVEQLVMNTRFELLTKLLEPVRAKLQQRMPTGAPCGYCFEKRGHAYDIHSSGVGTGSSKVRFQLGQTNSEAFILLNFNSYQKDHVISNDCFDLLLRIYASKALDYQIANVRRDVSTEPGSLGTDVQNSLDSLCGAFKMPKQAPTREQWTPDEEATHCMCCRRSAFTMLMRRHHCRRCGRVVCYACSTQRMVIPELYGDVEVRVCNDCCVPVPVDQPQFINEIPNAPKRASPSSASSYKWRLSGIITHDKLLREEFCYEHAPSVALSLSILRHHLDQRQCVDLLLFHCRKLEKLLVPNPEVDYELVAKMMNCLALAAKVRGAPGEFETIREHSEIIMAVVQQGCESLIPAGPLSNHSMRQLADTLVEAENWKLALDVHLKWGFATTGVMAAHGLACLRAGCYDAAREKFAHCMIRLSSEEVNSSICKEIFGKSLPVSSASTVLPAKKRPQRGPALLQEILQLIATLPRTQPQPETLQRASLIRNSNTSLASLFSRRREPYVVPTPLHEPAMNVMNALANLKRIAKGQYGEQAVISVREDEHLTRQSRDFEESLHYVLTYGSNTDIVTFLMQRDELRAALRYWMHQQLDTEIFIQHIFLVTLAAGRLPTLIEELKQLDPDAQLNTWRVPLLQTCRYLEQQQQLNSLYQLQLLLKDPVRASMTCVKFYPLHCDTFQKLHSNAQHLTSAHMHLQGELDLAQWEYLQREQQSSGRRSSTVSTNAGTCISMQLDARILNGHINTIRRQTELAKFLSQCEREQPEVNGLPCTLHTLKQIRPESPRGTLPTLFDGVADKIQLCILVLLCGKNIDEGFGLAYGIMQEYKLAPMKVFGATAKYLAKNQRLSEVDRLLDCIATNNGGSSASDSDELLSIAINAAVHTNEPETKQALDRLVKRIGSIELRISSYIFIGQLKSAYLLANKSDRLSDIRKILRQAEMTNQIHIKKLCEKKLNINATPLSPTPL